MRKSFIAHIDLNKAILHKCRKRHDMFQPSDTFHL